MVRGQTATTLVVLAYWLVVVALLATMLVDGLGWVAFGAYYSVLPLGALLVWRLAAQRPPLGIAVSPSLLRDSVLGALGAGLVVGGLYLVQRAVGWLDVTSRDYTLAGLVIGVVAQQAIVATIEELAFRGVVQNLLATQFGAARGLLAASALFGLFHLPNIAYQGVTGAHVPLTVAVLALMGLIFGWAYEWTRRRLALPVALHFGWNVACFGLQAAHDFRFTGPSWLTGVEGWFPESGLLGALGLTVLGGMVWRLKVRRRWHTVLAPTV